jgi:hypothetical protein
MRGFQLLILHKQNPHTQINHLSVIAKAISQRGPQMCVAPIDVQAQQTHFHTLHEKLPSLVHHS